MTNLKLQLNFQLQISTKNEFRQFKRKSEKGGNVWR